MANNQNYEALSVAARGAADGLSKLGPAGELLGHTLETVTKAADAAAQVVDSFVSRGRELAPYDAGLSAANAQADVRSLLEDIKEAQTLSEPLSRLTEAQSQASAELRELLLPLKEWVVERLADLMETVVGILRSAHATGQRIEVILDALWKLFLDVAPGSGRHLSDIKPDLQKMFKDLEEINRKMKGQNEESKPTFDQVMGDIFNQSPPIPAPAGGQPIPPVNGPFFLPSP